MFTTTRAEISAYLGLNILIGIHELPQLAMYWDSDKFTGVEAFKKTIPKYRFMTLGKYLHPADSTAEDQNNLLCKVCSLITRLEQKFAKSKNKYAYEYVKSEIFQLGEKIGLSLLLSRKKEKIAVPCDMSRCGNGWQIQNWPVLESLGFLLLRRNLWPVFWCCIWGKAFYVIIMEKECKKESSYW